MGDNNNLYYESENGEASVNIEGSNSEDSRVASPIDVANNHAYRDPYTNEILYGKADLYKLNKTIEPGEIYTLPDGFHEGTIIKAKDITLMVLLQLMILLLIRLLGLMERKL